MSKSKKGMKEVDLKDLKELKITDSLYEYDADEHTKECSSKPWTKDPNYFNLVKISAVALLKLCMHARSGVPLEVMGLLQGKIVGKTFVITDSFALPVEGTETRVNAQAEGYEYMIQYLELIQKVGRTENAVGWYHSHPGYGCWLSGIDVQTQMLNQQYSEPWIAIVVDPVRTISSSKVEIGAFRTYPKDYKPSDEGSSPYQTIPLEKIEDFGVHCKQYYPIEIEVFRSTLDSKLLDLLWNKYWVKTLSSSPMIVNRDYTTGVINDLSEKLEQAETKLSHSRMGLFLQAEKKEESQLSKVTKDSTKTCQEQIHAMMSQVLKNMLFNPPNTQK